MYKSCIYTSMSTFPGDLWICYLHFYLLKIFICANVLVLQILLTFAELDHENIAFTNNNIVHCRCNCYSWSFRYPPSCPEDFPQALRDFLFPYYSQTSCSVNGNSALLQMQLDNMSSKFQLKKKVASCSKQTVNWYWNIKLQNCRVPVKRRSGLTVKMLKQIHRLVLFVALCES